MSETRAPTNIQTNSRKSLVLLGAGLANTLIAWRLKQRQPDAQVRLIDQRASFSDVASPATWCCHGTDLTNEQHAWLEQAFENSWSGQSVRFPDYTRRLSTSYHRITPESLYAAAAPFVDPIFEGSTRVDDPGTYTAPNTIVVDGRGQKELPGTKIAYQAFYGMEIETTEPHGVKIPVIMDATVPQIGGYRFVYLLPFSRTRILVEDTRYQNGPELGAKETRRMLEMYIARQGWRIAEVHSEEQAALPIALSGEAGSFLDYAAAERGLTTSGLASGRFHATTGYSLPQAVRLADEIAEHWPHFEADVLVEDAFEKWTQMRYFRMLNRMLFYAADPGKRRGVFERFYKLDQGLIERFYAGQPTGWDMTRILMGKPPVPITRAVKAILTK